MKRILYIVLAVAVSSAIVSCGSKQTAQPTPPDYKVMTLDTTTTVIYNEFSTIISSDAIIDIYSRVTGYVAKKYINEGDLVEKGQMMYKIDDTEFRQQVQAAKAALESAKAQFANAQLEVQKLTPLVEKGIISPYELDAAKSNRTALEAGVEQAQANYDNAMTNLSYTEIRATHKGILGYTFASSGELVMASQKLTEIAIDGIASGYFSFNEKKLTPAARKTYQELQKQNRNSQPTVELMLPDGSIYPYKGKLYHATGRVDPTTGSIMLKVEFENPDYALLDGTSGTLRFPIEYKGAITVPQNATYELQDKIMVFVVNEDNTVTRKTIHVEGVAGNSYVVSNLERGTRIVTEGVDRLKDGMVITPKQ